MAAQTELDIRPCVDPTCQQNSGRYGLRERPLLGAKKSDRYVLDWGRKAVGLIYSSDASPARFILGGFCVPASLLAVPPAMGRAPRALDSFVYGWR